MVPIKPSLSCASAKIKFSISLTGQKTYVVAKNHSHRKSIVNSLQLATLTRNWKVKNPKNLSKYYPDLKQITQIHRDQVFQQINLPF